MGIRTSVFGWVSNPHKLVIGGTARSRSKRLSSRNDKLAVATRFAMESLETRTMLASTPFYWDPSGSTSASGGSGTWDTTSAQWRVGSATGDLIAWNNAGDANGPFQAVFTSAGGTVSLGQAISAGSILFTASSYSINGGSNANILTISSGSGLVGVSTGDAVISAVVSNSSGLIKTGTGLLSLTADTTSTSPSSLNVSQGSLTVEGHQIWQTVRVASASTLTMGGSGPSITANSSIIVDGTLDHEAGDIQPPSLNVGHGIFRAILVKLFNS